MDLVSGATDPASTFHRSTIATSGERTIAGHYGLDKIALIAKDQAERMCPEIGVFSGL